MQDPCEGCIWYPNAGGGPATSVRVFPVIITAFSSFYNHKHNH